MSVASADANRAWFATTRWSVVLSAGRGNDEQAREALESLCEKYWAPLYSFLRCRGYSREESQDLTQDFFLQLLRPGRVARADPERGRFRSFLLASLKNFVADEWDKQKAAKRGGNVQVVPLHGVASGVVYDLDAVDNETPEQTFERRWALTLLENVVTKLRESETARGNERQFELLSPCLVGERTNLPYAQLASELETTESAVKSAVHRLRGQYRRLLREEIANTVATPEEVDDELRYLFAVLSRRFR